MVFKIQVKRFECAYFMMRIAILVNFFPPKWLAGTEIATYNIAKKLAKKGYKVHVITSHDKGLPQTSLEEGFMVHRIFSRTISRLKIFGSLYLCLKILLILRKINPDIVHCQGLGMGLRALPAKLILQQPHIIWGQGSDINNRFEQIFLKVVLKNADAVIALTVDMKRKFESIFPRKVFIIPNGVEIEFFNNISRENARLSLKIKKYEKIILCVANLRPVKGIKFLIRAMEQITKEIPEAKLLLIGEGQDKIRLVRLVNLLGLQNSIIFIGKVPHGKIPLFMAASDVFVLPSLSEGQPLTILEAMASGLPIVATSVGGIPYTIINGVNGYLVEPANSTQLAEKIINVLKNDILREKIRESNIKCIKKFSLDKVITDLERLYLTYTKRKYFKKHISLR